MLRFEVRDVFVIAGRGTAVAGAVLTGDVTVGEVVEVERTAARSRVEAVESHPPILPLKAGPVGLIVPDLEPEDVRAGDHLIRG